MGRRRHRGRRAGVGRLLASTELASLSARRPARVMIGGPELEPGGWAGGLPSLTGTRVILLVLDGCGPEFALTPEMPAVAELAASGGMAPGGGIADLIASTAPSHATLLTGERPAVHGVLANRLDDAEDGIGLDVRSRISSILDLAHSAGRSV